MIKSKIYKTLDFDQKTVIEKIYELLGDKIVAHTERNGKLTTITVKDSLTTSEKVAIETLLQEKLVIEETVDVPST